LTFPRRIREICSLENKIKNEADLATKGFPKGKMDRISGDEIKGETMDSLLFLTRLYYTIQCPSFAFTKEKAICSSYLYLKRVTRSK